MTSPAPGWYADPSGKHEHRYWDGAQWTDAVSTGGVQSTDAGGSQQATAPVRVRTDKLPDQLAAAGVALGSVPVGSSLFDQPVLVVNQKAKLIEVTNEYAVFDAAGTQIGSVVEVGQGWFKKLIRILGEYDQYFTHRLEVRDPSGRAVLGITRPAKILKSRVIVTAPGGAEIGQIVQENMIGKIRFGFLVGGQRVGGINAENWRAWNFAIVDASGTEVARITKTWEGLAKTMFTTADKYVVQVHAPLQEPLRTLVVASALTVDTALKQDQRGFN